MLSSCEAAFTESPLIDTEEALSAGQNNTVSGMMRIQVSEDIAEKLLSMRDETGVVAPEILSEVGLGPEEGISRVSTTFMIGGRYEGRQRASGLHLWFDLKLDTEAVQTKSADDINRISGIAQVEPVFKVRLASVMNDPEYGSQWHYCNTGENGFRKGFDIGLEDMWRRYGVYGSPDVIVAVCDGGFDTTHPDLIDNLWVNEAELNGVKGKDDDNNGYVDDVHGYNFVTMSPVFDPDDHGNHVAGVVAAVNNNGIGVCGVAGGRHPLKGTRVMLLQTVGNNMTGYLKAMQYAAENGAVISQNSWGYAKGVNALLESDKTGIDYFIDNAGLDETGNQVGPMRGGLAVFSAGNDAVDIHYPSAYERCLSVGAIGPTGKVAYYSNYGEWVDVAAPGGDLEVNYYLGGVYSTMLDGKYGTMQGTSMACPHVSGLAALVLSKTMGEGYTASELYDHIVSTSNPEFYDYNQDKTGLYGAGMIDAVRAIAKLSKVAPEAPELVKGSTISNNLELTLTVPNDADDSTAFYYNIYLSEKPITEVGDASVLKYTFEIESASEQEDKSRHITISRLDFEKEYHCSIMAADYAGNESPIINAGTFKTEANNKPVIEISDNESILLSTSDIVTRTMNYSDPDKHTISVSFSTTASKGIEFTEISNELGVVKIDGATSDMGTFEFTVTVTDEFGLSNSITCPYTIKDNSAPIVIKEIEDIHLDGVSSTVELVSGNYFSDPDNDSLTLTFDIADKNVAEVSSANGKITIKAAGIGSTMIKATASDPSGESASSEFNVTVFDPFKPYTLYPNPVIDVLNILGTTSRSTSIKIYSSTGKLMYDETGNTSINDIYSADLSNLPPGLYNVVLTPEDGDRYSTSIMKL